MKKMYKSWPHRYLVKPARAKSPVNEILPRVDSWTTGIQSTFIKEICVFLWMSHGCHVGEMKSHSH